MPKNKLPDQNKTISQSNQSPQASVEKQNQSHNTKKEAMGPNTKR